MRASDGEPRTSGIITISVLAATPAALDDFEVEELIADASTILRNWVPYQPLSKLTFPSEVSKSGSFLGGVLGRSSETSLHALPPKAAALETALLLSRVTNDGCSARMGSVPIDIRRLAFTERYTPGPIPVNIKTLPVCPVAVGVVRLLDDQVLQ